jgi:hypothetical protein
MRYEPAQKRWLLAGVTSFGVGENYCNIYIAVLLIVQLFLILL